MRVQPRSSRNTLEIGVQGELRARVTAPPVDSAANQAVIALLAEAAGVAKSRVRLLVGDKARNKTFLIKVRPLSCEYAWKPLSGADVQRGVEDSACLNSRPRVGFGRDDHARPKNLGRRR